MRTCLRRTWWLCVFPLLLPGGDRVAVAATPPEGDRPLKILRDGGDFAFPRKLRGVGVSSGQVRFYLDVDKNGELVDHLIVAFTHFEFANTVTKTVGRWRFVPAHVGGRPIASTILCEVRFEVSGVTLWERTASDPPVVPPHEFSFRARELAELDRLPRATATVAPTNPAAADAPAITGRARVSFFIDENGRVRMPVVEKADDPRLGWAALAAIAQWTFEPPLRGGRPVLARASQVFVFEPER